MLEVFSDLLVQHSFLISFNSFFQLTLFTPSTLNVEGKITKPLNSDYAVTE